MNFRKIAVLALFATTLVASFAVIAHAEESSAPVKIGIESVCGQRAHLFNVRNTGFVTASALRYRLIARAHETMPALYTEERTLNLVPGQMLAINAPRQAWGLKVSIEFDAAPGLEVTQSGLTAVSYPSFCW